MKVVSQVWSGDFLNEELLRGGYTGSQQAYTQSNGVPGSGAKRVKESGSCLGRVMEGVQVRHHPTEDLVGFTAHGPRQDGLPLDLVVC
jgi:hypothetical protein